MFAALFASLLGMVIAFFAGALMFSAGNDVKNSNPNGYMLGLTLGCSLWIVAAWLLGNCVDIIIPMFG